MQTQNGPITEPLVAPAPSPHVLYLVFHGAELFSTAPDLIAIISDAVWLAALRRGRDGCITGLFSSTGKIKLHARQSALKWIPSLPAGTSEVRR